MTCILSGESKWRCCSALIYTVCTAPSVQLPSAAVSFCCPGTWHWFYLEGGEEDVKLFGRTPSPRTFFLCALCVCFALKIWSGWMGGNNTAKRNQETLTHTVMSDVCACGSVFDFSHSLEHSLSYKEMWARLQIIGPFIRLSLCEDSLSISL